MKRILFVDDESRILDGVRRMMRTEREHWDMDFAVGGEAALQAFDSATFDVVVSDMRMPGMDGATLLGHIRDRSPATVRIILSGHTELEAATRAIPVAHRFLAKPCEAATLRETIQRACTLQDLLGCPEIRRVVSSIGELPSLSVTYSALTTAVADPETSIGTVATIVEQDMAMSAKVLHFANNAFFGAAQPVRTVLGAVSYLGIDTIKNLVLTVEAFRAFSPNGKVPACVYDNLQNHAQATAAIAGRLPVEKKLRDTVIVAALLHEIGKLILATTMPRQFLEIEAAAEQRNCKTFLVEEEIFGISHAEIGAYLLGIWGLSHVTVEAIAHHHRPNRIPHSGLDCTAAVFAADLLSHCAASPPRMPSEEENNDLRALGIADQFQDWRLL